jgi:hypothetical protein
MGLGFSYPRHNQQAITTGINSSPLVASQISISPIVIPMWIVILKADENPAKHSSTGFSSNTNHACLTRNLGDDVKISR